MADIKNNFNDNDIQLISPDGNISGEFGAPGDFIRLTIRNSRVSGLTNLSNLGRGATVLYSSLEFTMGEFQSDESLTTEGFQTIVQDTGKLSKLNDIVLPDNNQFKIYHNTTNGHLYLKLNEILSDNEIRGSGNYNIQIDFVRQVRAFKDTEELPFPQYLEEFDVYVNSQLDSMDSDRWKTFNRYDIANYIEENLNEMYELHSSGVGQPDLKSPEYFHAPRDRFVVKEISPSRKEVRLKLQSSKITRDDLSGFVYYFKDFVGATKEDDIAAGFPEYKYNFILHVGEGRNIPITNYHFDPVKEGRNNQSIILRLYEPLPDDITLNDICSVEQEVLLTQLENIHYFPAPVTIETAGGLEVDSEENWLSEQTELDTQFQNLDDLSGSLSLTSFNNLISGSDYNYPNLKVDYSNFSNHTHFGSAKRKLANFETKVKTIQGYYSDISSSLSASAAGGLAIEGDSLPVIAHRKELFNKIQKEIDLFTPYERFLYFDGQGESTASAPGLGKNYADAIPIKNSSRNTTILNKFDGFDVVYQKDSVKLEKNHSRWTDLFTNKYWFEEKPFFNYSGSIYLSFLLKGHGISGSQTNGTQIVWENRQRQMTPKQPYKTLNKTRLINPTITGSEYKRFVFRASGSHWVPTSEVDYDAGSVTDFNSTSTQLEILSGPDKTGSNPITATGDYQHLATVVTQSGVPFSGSIMPAGEIFRVYFTNPLSESLFAHYNYENVTIDDADFEVPDVSGNGRTVSWVGGSTLSYTSASIKTGVDGKASSSLYWSGSGGSGGTSGLTYLDSAIDSDEGRVIFTGSYDGFSFATWLKTEDSSFTMMALDIKASGSIMESNDATSSIAHGNQLSDTDGWWMGKAGSKISGQVTDHGFKVLDDADFNVNPSDTDLTDGNFHHYVMVWNNNTGTGSLYVDGNKVKTLAGRAITGSNHIYKIRTANGPGSALGYGDGQYDETRYYLRALEDWEVYNLYETIDGNAKALITDAKITLNDPTDVLPFDTLYHTSSAAWTNWYNGMYDSASAFDDDNIHSLENNLPTYIQENSDYDEVKRFLALQGEHYDIVKNYIDSYTTFHNRKYNDVDSVPDNLLPMLLQNLGWNPILPFSGSLADYFGSVVNSVTDIDKVSKNTWRKTLNNLMYLYKSKGTKNAVRGLLNTYGYPPDVLGVNEYGISTEPHNDAPLAPTASIGTSKNDVDLSTVAGNVSYALRKDKLLHYKFNNNPNRILKTNWYYNNAEPNVIEFVYKHKKSTNTQEILTSTGSLGQTLWDFIIVPSADGASSSFQFRLNNSLQGGTSIATRGFSMSLDYHPVKEGELWNLMVQRMTSSISGTGTQEYQLYAALQEASNIRTLSHMTMSVSGGVKGDPDEGYYANQNWFSTGSGTDTVSSSNNLIMGRTLSGSLAEFRTWKNPLSASKFRLHTLNKSSTVGNTINSHRDELIYHYKFNENYTTSSVSSSTQTDFTLVDSAPKYTLTTDYSITMSANLFTSSVIFGSDLVDKSTIGLQNASTAISNQNKIIISPQLTLVGNLTPFKPSVIPLTDKIQQKDKRTQSSKLDINRSPQDFVNNFILEKIQGFKLENYYGNPQNRFSSSYGELDNLRREFFEIYPITVDTNKFIRAHENIWSHALTEGLKNIIPARATLSDKQSAAGVTIKPTILEKQRVEYKKPELETNPNKVSDTIEIINPSDYKSGFGLTDSSYESTIDETLDVNEKVLLDDSIVELTKDDEVVVNDIVSLDESKLVSTYNSEIKYIESGSYDAAVSILGNVVEPISGTNNYISTHWNKSFENIHDSWGTSSSDTHFLNMATANADTSSDGDYNVNHIDRRYHFYMVGDVEVYSSSMLNPDDFSNHNHFHNKMIISDFIHKNTIYESYINGNPGLQTGRAIGKTRYFYTASDGTITYPSNHVSQFNNPWLENMYDGFQNTDPGILNVKQEDYATSSFYRVKVTGGENKIIVRQGQPKLDSDDKIIY